MITKHFRTSVKSRIFQSKSWFYYEVLIVALTMAWLLAFMPLTPMAASVQLPQTGQENCYDTAGIEIPCAGTGQDADLRKGVAWPNPRFSDNGDGTITDNLTGLMWAKDAGTPTTGECIGGSKSHFEWQESFNYVACLNKNNYLGHSDWRIPNINEIESLSNAGAADLATWLNGQGFENVQALGIYLSSTSLKSQPDLARVVPMWGGNTCILGKSTDTVYYPVMVWPVRNGKTGIIQLPQTGQTSCYDTTGIEIPCSGSMQDGEIRAGTKWPDPRFIDNMDGTIIDKLTGLMWTKDAGSPNVQTCVGGTPTWQGALDYVKCLNEKAYLGYKDWRLPNWKELYNLSLNDLLSNPFENILGNPWSSTTYSLYTDAAWVGVPTCETAYYKYVGGFFRVWPVRDNITPPQPTHSLTIKLNPEPAGKVTGNGIDCGSGASSCNKQVNQGDPVTLNANPTRTGWKFLHWVDGNSFYVDNPLTMSINSDKTMTAVFVPDGHQISLNQVGTDALGNRTPLIVVHGNNSETKNRYGWGTFIDSVNIINKIPWNRNTFSKKYKMYLARWDSKWPNLDNGLALGQLIDGLIAGRSDLVDKQLVILAHSRGGLVSRFYMNYSKVYGGQYDGQKAGERVKNLVTLATPHRGSPGADPTWVQFSFDRNYDKATSQTLEVIYWSVPLYEPQTQRFLLWDDVDDQISNNQVCWNSPLHNGKFCDWISQRAVDDLPLLTLNQNEAYLGKIIAWGGNNFYPSYNIAWLLNYTGLSPADHVKLLLATRLMADMPIIPNSYNYDAGNTAIPSTRPFQANDGLVPLTSALFLKPGSNNLFTVNWAGSVTYNKNQLDNQKLVSKVNIEASATDHLHFLDKPTILLKIINELNTL